jgi:biopolymer transport protein ExbD
MSATPTDNEPLMPLPKPGHDEDLIDMTAMVDIVFFLLIFFLTTSFQAMQAVINLPTPEAIDDSGKAAATAQIQTDPNAIMIKIEEDNTILVDEEEMDNDDVLVLTLKQTAADRASPSALIIGNPDATHGTAVRVLDACASARIENVRFFVPQPADSD